MSKRVLLGDVVSQIKDKVDKDNTNLEYYIGGEHIDNNRRVINRRGALQGSTIGSAFKMRFKPGDVLLMSRNPHLCKASMVDFEGICSDVSYVCRTNDESVFSQRLLPFLMQTDAFWNHAEKNKRGGMPFFLNWKDFATFEFNLPSPDEQEKIADLLWAAEETKNAYETQLAATEDLVKGRFVEMFGDPILNDKNFPTEKLNKICPVNKYKGEVEKTDGKVWTLNLDMIESNTGRIIDYVYCSENEVPSSTIKFNTNCVLYSKLRPYLNKVVIPSKSGYGTSELLSLDSTKINKYYLAALLMQKSFVDFANGTSYGAKMPRASVDNIKDFDLMIPPQDAQYQFEDFIKQIDKSKFELKQAIEKIDTVIKSLSEQTFA